MKARYVWKIDFGVWWTMPVGDDDETNENNAEKWTWCAPEGSGMWEWVNDTNKPRPDISNESKSKPE